MNDQNAIDALLKGLPELLTTEEVGKLMRVDTTTVTRWAEKFGLKIISIGPRVKRIRRDDLKEFLLTSDEKTD